MIYLYIFSAILIVSLISFIGVFTITLKPDKLKNITMLLVSLSAGTLLGDSFIHLMPEAIENGGGMEVWLSLLGGLLTFFILEKLICWRHCHVPTSEHHPHPVGIMNLVGDGIHNLLDGIVIAGSFLASIPLGITTSIAVFAHEVPQEIGDLGVLIHAGYSRLKALKLNFLIALTSGLGAVIAIIIGQAAQDFQELIIPFTAGGFIYVSTADLIPELKKEAAPRHSLNQLIFIVLGILMMLALKLIFG